MDKKSLSERDICTKFITPALRRAGWDEMTQIREEVSFTKGRIIVRGKLVSRGKGKRADYILYYRPNLPIAVIEAKDNHHAIGDGMQQALDYAATLDVPFVFSSNGDGFVFHDRTGASDVPEKTLALNAFPSPGDLWARYRAWKGLVPEAEAVVLQDYHDDGSGKAPRYYQTSAINAAIEAIAKGRHRVLLVMATGTGKTYTAFQIIWRLWKAGRKKRILFLADRNVLVDQTRVNDFRPFEGAMAKLSTEAGTIVRHPDGTMTINKSYEIYLGLYQAITGPEEHQKLFREFSPSFFDLIVTDECHRGSAADDSAWREILEYFSSATQVGLTATPKETRYVSNIHYFGEPVYTYSLKQGIRDGFLAPYKVIKVHVDRDVEGYRPEIGQLDRRGVEVEDRIYNTRTPRAVTAFMADRIDPKPGEILFDPACGTGGFLTCALRHMRQRYVKRPEDERTMQAALRAVEKKQLPHMLCVTNMLLHGIEDPGFVRHDNTLARPFISWAHKDRVDIVLTNPPFGGKEEDGIESNFPAHFRTKETADLFLALIIRLLKPGGRAAVVLPDGSLFGEGVKTRLKEHLLEECNLHTIVRLPNSVFRPYASIGTNLLFFEKGGPTTDIWFYEHRVPDGQKAYSMTKPIRLQHLQACID